MRVSKKSEDEVMSVNRFDNGGKNGKQRTSARKY